MPKTALTTRRRRPWLVTCLSGGVLIFTAVQVSAVLAWFRLPELPLHVWRGYLLVKTLFWGLAGAGVAVGLFFGRPWSPPLATFGSWLFVLWFWIDRLWLVLPENNRTAKGVLAALTLGSASAITWVLSRSAVRQFFGEHVP